MTYSGLMKNKILRTVIAPAVVVTAAVMLLSFYVTGVVDRAKAREIIGERLEQICDDIDEKTSSSQQLTEEIYSGYRSKARVVSMMLSKNADIISDESSFEEMRVAIGADLISVTDENGIIRYSTDLAVEETPAHEEFMPAIKNKVFSEALLSEESGSKVVVTGSARLDKPGIIQITFSLENYQQQLETSELSGTVTQIPLMQRGHLAVIDPETNTYLSHTDKYMIGSAVQFDPEGFSKDSGWFSSQYEGKRVLVRYKKHNGLIAAGILPYQEIYHRRCTILRWIFFSAVVLTVAVMLSIRNSGINSDNTNDKGTP